ncbi:hypothetical protein V6N13_124153 [Hibiscus sabdariffa]|uniref:Uncharacterized protein n=1 Tax=Hibiscus sabdariffa TaxID=183260 RepID=A0ABR2S151_9ROSI
MSILVFVSCFVSLNGDVYCWYRGRIDGDKEPNALLVLSPDCGSLWFGSKAIIYVSIWVFYFITQLGSGNRNGLSYLNVNSALALWNCSLHLCIIVKDEGLSVSWFD